MFEMKALQVCKALYCSYSKQSMVVLEIIFNEGLWQKMWELTLKLYDDVNLKKMQKYTKESNELKSSLEDFAKKNCKILVEVPSCTASEGIYMMQKTDNPYCHGIEMEEECCLLVAS